MESGKLVLIIGPSGVGKSVILGELRKLHPEFHFPKSATTRKRRDGEGDDIYHFVTETEFDHLLRDKKVLEWAVVHGGGRYATLLDEIIPAIEAGKTVIREVDVQGFERIRNDELFGGMDPPYKLVSIFLLPESKEQLLEHIQKRAPMSHDEVKRRMTSMQKELDYANLCTAQIVSKEGKLDEVLRDVEQAIAEEA